MSTKVRPAKKFLQTSTKCSKEGLAYGQCVLQNYTNMSKDTCAAQFGAFKQCVTAHLK